MERAAYTIDEAAVILGISRNSAYEAARRGDLPVIRIGRTLRVPKVLLEKMIYASIDNTCRS